LNKAILYAIAFAFFAVLAMWLFWHVLGTLYYFGWMLFWLGLLAFVLYLTWTLMKPKLPVISMQKKPAHKLVDIVRPHVYAFRSEPELKDIVLLSDELHVAKLELAGDVVQLNNGTVIKILEDEGKEAVKIKVSDKKVKEKVFWVPRSSIADFEPGSKLKPKRIGGS
jgi:hypothetical protein